MKQIFLGNVLPSIAGVVLVVWTAFATIDTETAVMFCIGIGLIGIARIITKGNFRDRRHSD